MDQPVDVPFAIIQSMPDLAQVATSDGTTGDGRRFAIYRYVSKTTGRVYECVFMTGEQTPRCAEFPPEKPQNP